MKNSILVIAIAIISLMASCGETKEDRFEIVGRVENRGDVEKVFLYEGESMLDSANITSANEFRFNRAAEGSDLYTLIIGLKPYMLVLENGDNVELEVDLKRSEAEYTVSGSEVSSRLQELAVLRDYFQKEQAFLQSEFEERIGGGESQSAVQNELMAKSFEITNDIAKQVLEFSEENRENLAGFYGFLLLYSIDPSSYEQEIIEYAEDAKGRFASNRYVQSFANYIGQLKPLSIGQEAPDFVSITPDGKQVKLSDLKGKYVLLDFWASWCAPCREENPNIVEQYHAYKDKDKDFTVIGVSLDRSRDAWIKAIKDDRLDWLHVSDLKQWDSEAGKLYNIEAIPASFLISPEGKIIGKNLRGPALKEFLEKTL